MLFMYALTGAMIVTDHPANLRAIAGVTYQCQIVQIED